MKYARLTITAADEFWLQAAINSICGYATSVIGCDAEVGLENQLGESETPDNRPGASILLFGFSAKSLCDAVVNRCGQCLMTCPSTAVFDGLPDQDTKIELGSKLRYFGDGFQKSKLLDQRLWRIPVMDGEFVVSERVGIAKGVGGGNFILQAGDERIGLAATRAAVEAIAALKNVITPFPGGAVRSGSKVGSKYKALKASTNEAFCPTLRQRVVSKLVNGANWAMEIVIDGTDDLAVKQAMACGIEAATKHDLLAISAGNYGGKLGKFHFHLRDLV